MVFEAKNNAIRLASKIAVRLTILTFTSILMTASACLQIAGSAWKRLPILMPV